MSLVSLSLLIRQVDTDVSVSHPEAPTQPATARPSLVPRSPPSAKRVGSQLVVQSLSHGRLLGAHGLSTPGSSGRKPSSPGVTLEVGAKPQDMSQQTPRGAGVSWPRRELPKLQIHKRDKRLSW